MNYEEILRNRITSLRMEKNISEYQLSLDLGKCKTYIQAITSGKSLPSFDAFFDLCDYFGLTPEEFFATAPENARLRRLCRKLSSLSEQDLSLTEQLLDRLLLAEREGSAL